MAKLKQLQIEHEEALGLLQLTLAWFDGYGRGWPVPHHTFVSDQVRDFLEGVDHGEAVHNPDQDTE